MQSVEDLFFEALELAPAERAAFLARNCADEPGKRAAVEGLLVDADGAEAFFGAAPTLAAHPAHRTASQTERSGDWTGPYRLLDRLGEGGFGVVWRAEQHAPIHREVAVKVIKAGMDTAEVLARFQAERQALARMDHTNIARVLDAGETPLGRPFVVMELIHGPPITRFCDEANLGVEQRLHLFLDLCGAISHAHQKGVIHRDLKPSNILIATVGGRPTVKVIDFGIAKATEGRLTDATMLTLGPQNLGTPVYMSPEQAGVSEQDVDTRADVYGLGALLYELLSGATPFDARLLTEASYEERRRILREVEPPLASERFKALPAAARMKIAESRALPPDSLPRLLAKDLDWVLRRAMAKAREQRYPTVDALAEDISRFLAREPVTARAPTKLYVLATFAQRHRRVLGILAVIGAILLLATAVSAWLAIRATHAEGRAQSLLRETELERNAKARALKDSQAVSDLLVDVFRLPSPDTNSRAITLADALQKANTKLDATLSNQPERKALLKQALAQTYEGLGLYLEATDLRQQVLRLSKDALGADAPATMEAMQQLSRLLALRGYYRDAADLQLQELEIRKRLGGAESPEAKRVWQLREENLILAGQKPRPATPPLPAPVPTATPPALSDAERNALIKARLASQEEALKSLEKDHAPTDGEVLSALKALAESYSRAAYRNDAARVQSTLVERLRTRYGETHFITMDAEDNLAYLYWRAGNWRDSIRVRENVLEKRKKVFGPEHSGTLECETMLIEQLYVSKVPDRALQMGYEVVPLLDRVLGKEDRTTAHGRSFFARALLHAGKTEDGIRNLKECGPHMNDDTLVNLMLANLEIWFGDFAGYQKTRSRMLDYAIATRATALSRPDILERSVLIGLLAPNPDPRQMAEIRRTLDRCAEIRSANNGAPLRMNYPGWCQFMDGYWLYRSGDFKAALEKLDDAYARNVAAGKQKSQPAIHALRAACLHQLKQPAEARKAYDLAAQLMSFPTDQKNPLAGKNAFDGEDLTDWNALLEAKKLLAQPSP